MKFILALVALCITSVAAQAKKPEICAQEAAAVPACGQKCIEEAAGTVGCSSKDYACYCKNATKYQTAAGKCLLAQPCRAQALASKNASENVCTCVSKLAAPPPADGAAPPKFAKKF